MDPASTAMGIGTLFGYLAQFFAERASNRKSEQQATIDEYLEWLRRNNHQQLVDLINGSADLTRGLKELLGQQHKVVLDLLHKIDSVVCAVAAGIDEFRPIAKLFPNSCVSCSAIGILQWLTQGGYSGFFVVDSRGDGKTLLSLGRPDPTSRVPDIKNSYDVIDARYFVDDVGTLLQLGLLKETFNSKGKSVYHITRPGSEVAKAAALVETPPASEPQTADYAGEL